MVWIYYIDLANNQLSGLIPNSICNLDWNYSSISNNQLCPPYPTCIENQVGYQNISGCGQSLPGNECETSEGSIGFYDCDLCCWDSYFLSWLGDNYCDQLGGCGWEGPQFNCIELGYDCGDCNSDWNGMNSSGLCVGIDFCDLNSDNMLNVIDVIIIINCILGLGDCDDCMDYNEDGEINILDIIRLVEYILE